MNPMIEIILIASIIATSSALVGVFLVLRRVSLLSDAISHAILLGIVLAFLITKDLASPLLIIGAALVGVITVTATELLIATKKLKEDASIGLVFPILFALAVILINLFASNVHLDQDAVLLGELAFAPFERLTLFGFNLPRSLWINGIILGIDLLFILLFYKELKITTFDPYLAASLGFSPVLLHYGLMSLVSITAVGAFDAVGSILVVALMIAPPATAYLLTNHLWKMMSLSIIIGLLAGVSGYGLAHWVDASIAGSMAMMTGVFFALAWLSLIMKEQQLSKKKIP
ncbi:metal ABC transporter permease [Candidatus Woesearchaeota archaeon]|nr:metal ABC transporter permease [Candidatus Woesearchaeota archaeon]